MAEKRNPEGKIQPSGYRTLTIPHPNFRALQLQNLVIKPQVRGEHYAEAVLKDNSKMRVYLDSEAKAMAYIKNLLTSYVDSNFFPSRNLEDFIQIGATPDLDKWGQASSTIVVEICGSRIQACPHLSWVVAGIRPQIKKVTLYPRKADYYAVGVHKNVTPDKSHTFGKSDKHGV